ncbi:MAG: diguanylate cyclase [Sphaerochaetaceae bacterium]|nr:diguanylate cyclase [Sphaerochaetaceae bacterium]
MSGLWIFMASAFVILSLILINARQIRIPLVRCFTVLMGCALLWNLFFIFELASIDFNKKLLFSKIQFIGISMIPFVWFRFAMLLTKKKIRSWISLLLVIIPVVTLVMVWLVPNPNMFWGFPKMVRQNSSLVTVDYDYGVWFNFIFSPYMVAMIISSIIMIARNLGRSQQVYKKQISLIALGAAIPLTINSLYLFGISPIQHLNFSTASLSITGVMYGWALFRYRFLDLVPIAREIIVEQMGDAVFVLDYKNRLVDFNKKASSLITVSTSPIGNTLSQVGLVHLDNLVSGYTDAEKSEIPITLNRHIFDVDIQKLTKTAEKVEATIITLHDVTEREDLYRQVSELALRDPLTGLYNRRALFEQTEILIEDLVLGSGQQIAAIMFDIDNFKTINDSYGHASGDRVLVSIAKNCLRVTKAQDIIGRIGGDEFVIILHGASSQNALKVANMLHDQIGSMVFYSRNTTFNVSISAGISTSSQIFEVIPGQFLEKLITHADTALYKAKDEGKNCVKLFQ